MSELKILFAGDTFPVANNISLFQEGRTEEIFGKKVCELFESADYSVCNLEGCLTDTGIPVEKVGPNVKAPTDTLNALSALGIKAATLANTHTLDFGSVGHDEMRNALRKYHIDFFGTGDSIDDIKSHITLDIKGKKITLYTVTELFAFNTPDKNKAGANGYDEYRVCRELAELKENCDYLVVLYHGGAEMTHYNTPSIRRRFHCMADNGVDIIISQHTHATGCEEYYKNSYLLYGQGNFCFNLSKNISEFTASGILLEVVFGENGFDIQKHLVRRTETGCEYDEEQDFSTFEERSRLHDRLINGDREAEYIFQKEFSDYCRNMWFTRLMRVFRGINPEDDKALADLSQKEQETYLISKFTKTQLSAIQMMLANDEFNEIALNFITQAINDKE